MKKTCIHILPCKINVAEIHNHRLKNLDYVRNDLSSQNEFWNLNTIGKNYKNKPIEIDLFEYKKAIIKKYESQFFGLRKQRWQKKATPLREAVVVISEATTMQDLLEFNKICKQEFGIRAIDISIHKDEGHYVEQEWKPNLHAHIIFDWTEEETGRSIKLNKQDMARMQTLLAECLNMQRGVSSDKKHLDAIAFKVQAEEQRLKEEEQQLKEIEDNKQQLLKDTAIVESAINLLQNNVEFEELEELEDIKKRHKGLLNINKDAVINELYKLLKELYKNITDIVNKQIAILSQQFKNKEQDLYSREEALNKKLQDNKNLDNTIQQKQDELNKINTDIASKEKLSTQIKALNTRKNNINAEVKQLEKTLKEAQEKIELAQSITATQEDLENLIKEKKRVIAEHAKQEKEIKERIKQAKQKEQDITELKAEYGEINASKKEIKAERDKLQEEKESLSESLKTLNNEIERLQEVVKNSKIDPNLLKHLFIAKYSYTYTNAEQAYSAVTAFAQKNNLDTNKVLLALTLNRGYKEDDYLIIPDQYGQIKYMQEGTGRTKLIIELNKRTQTRGLKR